MLFLSLSRSAVILQPQQSDGDTRVRGEACWQGWKVCLECSRDGSPRAPCSQSRRLGIIPSHGSMTLGPAFTARHPREHLVHLGTWEAQNLSTILAPGEFFWGEMISQAWKGLGEREELTLDCLQIEELYGLHVLFPVLKS